jgi:hypothetical protein
MGAELGLPFAVGVPFPVAIAEARIGGFLLPFDVGVKYGYIPDQVPLIDLLPAGMSVDYEAFGVDVRLRLIEERTLLPELSVGGGFNYLRGGIGLESAADYTIDGLEVPNPSDPDNPYVFDLGLASPVVGFNWETAVFDVKAQLSKRLLYFFTPYVGAGVTIGSADAGGGLQSELTLTPDPSTYGLTFDDINELLAATGADALPMLDENGFSIASEMAGYAARAFAGLSLNLLFIRADATVLYEIASRTIGASVNVRLQF